MSDNLPNHKPKALRRKRGRQLLALIVAAITVFVPCCTYYAMQNRMGVNVSRDEVPAHSGIIPKNATNINYFVSGAFGPACYLEFNVSEETFIQVAQEQGWIVREIFSDSPVRVIRPEAFAETENENLYPQVFNGWYWTDYSKRDTDDYGYNVTFDRDKNRVFYAHSRH